MRRLSQPHQDAGSRRRLLVPLARALQLVGSASPLLTVALVAATVISGLIPAGIALLQRDLLDRLTAHGTAARPAIWYAAALVVAGILVAVMPDLAGYAQAQLGRVVGLRSQDRLFRALNSFPGIARFESPQFMDAVQMAKGMGQSSAMNVIISSFGCSQSVLGAAALAAALWIVSPLLTALVIVAVVPALCADLAFGRLRADLQWQLAGTSRRQMFYGNLQTDLHAAKEIRLFGIGGFLRNRMLTELRSINKRQARLDRRSLRAQTGLAVIASAVTGAGLIWTVREAASGVLPIGDVSMFVLASAGIQGALGSAITSVADSYQAIILFSHYTDILALDPDLPVAERPRPIEPLTGSIEIRDVWFRYDGAGPWILRGLTMTIAAGSAVGLVGVNGAGKSTLVKLLCRLYDPQRGAIYWNGVDIREVDPEQLRDRIGAVFQDYMAYDLTAAENIGLGDLARMQDSAAIRDAAVMSGVAEAVERLRFGFDTLLSRIFFDNADKDDPRTGVVLSGGQWQRLALARGLMRAGRDLLILDEPTAGLDADGEAAIHRQLRQLRAGRSSLLISHRLGALRDADMIYVLADGQIAERGEHAELMVAGGEYARLFALQASGYDLKAESGAAISGHHQRSAGAPTAV
jgi:ATP-binding cassette, subfamily B, bacterial